MCGTTNDVREFMKDLGHVYYDDEDGVDYNITQLDKTQLIYVIDWLNAHHFDYRGLIEKGLALVATEGMY